ncbi:PriCT-2 domain-containing protein [Thiomicrospira microaerophila]|uniref:PriCT-2 domain-containing protein n=1 Tax=Thiomicrospira microaerophila TaxID=406020 RepID=UPI0005C9A667|nr:PriCT-2 domain-containing protein [Thiomicrospira microaerophila]
MFTDDKKEGHKLTARQQNLQPAKNNNTSAGVMQNNLPGFSLDQACDMLDHLSADMSRSGWIRVLMALKSEFGETAKPVAQSWSELGQSFDLRDFNSAWRSIKPGCKVTIGTLYHMAKQAGYRVSVGSLDNAAYQSYLKVLPSQVWKGSTECDYDKAAEYAKILIKNAQPATSSHPYLLRKNIQPCGVLRDQSTGDLLIPVYNFDSSIIQTVQRITAAGKKRFLKGGAVTGGSYTVQNGIDRNAIYICEGFATGASLAENQALGKTVVCCFSLNNLMHVAKAVRTKYPDAHLIIAGDNDHQNSLNPGLAESQKVAVAVGGQLFVPPFNDGDAGSDWNDYNLAQLVVAKGGVA